MYTLHFKRMALILQEHFWIFFLHRYVPHATCKKKMQLQILPAGLSTSLMFSAIQCIVLCKTDILHGLVHYGNLCTHFLVTCHTLFSYAATCSFINIYQSPLFSSFPMMFALPWQWKVSDNTFLIGLLFELLCILAFGLLQKQSLLSRVLMTNDQQTRTGLQQTSICKAKWSTVSCY